MSQAVIDQNAAASITGLLLPLTDRTLLVPNVALRFTPQATAAEEKRSFLSKIMPGPPPAPPKTRAQEKPKPGAGTVWVKRQGGPEAVSVQMGLSNGRYTEVLSEGLTPGMAVITDTQQVKR